MPTENQKGFAHILGLLVLLAGLIASVYLIQQKTNLFSRAASAPVSMSCSSQNPTCPTGYKCQLEATTPRQCPVSARNCNTAVGKCVPGSPATSGVCSTTKVKLYPYGGGVTPQATGGVTVELLDYNRGTDLAHIRLSGSLQSLMPKRTYKVWLCGSDGATCGTSSIPQIVTNSTGNAQFAGVTFSMYNRPANSISDVKVVEQPPFGAPVPPQSCSSSLSPCLTGGYTIARAWPCGTPTPTPAPIVCSACSADLNKDGQVNMADFGKLAGCMNKKSTDSGWSSCQMADLNGDKQVNISDLNCIRSQYLKKCSTPKR